MIPRLIHLSRGTSHTAIHAMTTWLVRRFSGYDVGVVLVSASLLKAHEVVTDPFARVGGILSRMTTVSLVEAEFGFGLWMLFGFFPWATRGAAIACFSLLAVVSGYRALTGASDCGCFGRASISPWLTLLIDALVVIGLTRVWPPTANSRIGNQGLAASLGFCTVVFWVGAPMAISMASPAGRLGEIALQPESWIGRCLPVLERIDIGGKLAHGDWTVVFYRNHCPVRRREIPEYERFARFGADHQSQGSVALIEVPPYGHAGERIVSPNSPCAIGRLDDTVTWRIKTPTVLKLRDCLVLKTGQQLPVDAERRE